MKRLSLAIAIACAWLTLITPARAALILDYSPTDDVWNPPVPAGHFLVDTRIGYTLASNPTTLAPTLSLVCGLGNGTEVGLFGSYLLNNLGLAGANNAPQVLSPYFKMQFPGKLGNTVFGWVGAAQIQTAPNQLHVMAIEGVASIQATDVLLIDLGLGTGVDLGLGPSPLGHANATVYYTIPSGQTVFGEVFGQGAFGAPATYGQHVGVNFPLAKGLTGDANVTAYETVGVGLIGVMPMVGATYTY